MNVFSICALIAAVKATSGLDTTCEQNASKDPLDASGDSVVQVDITAPGSVLLQSGRSHVTKLTPSHEDQTGQQNHTGRVLLQFNRSGLMKSNSSHEDELWSAVGLKGLARNLSQRLDNLSRDIARVGSLAIGSLSSFVKEAYLPNSTNFSSQALHSLASISSLVRSAGVLSNETIVACRMQLGAFMSVMSEPFLQAARPGHRITTMAVILVLLVVLFCLLSLLVYRRKKSLNIYGEDDQWKHESWWRDRQQGFMSEPVSLAAGEGGGSFSFARDPLSSSYQFQPHHDHGPMRSAPPAYHRDAWNSPASRESTDTSIDSSASRMYQQQAYKSGSVRKEMLRQAGAPVTQAYGVAAAAGGAVFGVAGEVGATAAAGARQANNTTGQALSSLAQAVDSKAERLKMRWEEARAAHL